MKISRFTKKLLSCLFTAFILLFGMSGTAYCSNLNTINQKMKHTQEKIKTLKLKENHEKSKLVRNQRKLENTSNTLEASKRQYNTIDSRLQALQAEYAAASNDFNKTDAQLKTRIRQVFKNQRTGMFELLLSAKDLNSFLDFVYFDAFDFGGFGLPFDEVEPCPAAFCGLDFGSLQRAYGLVFHLDSQAMGFLFGPSSLLRVAGGDVGVLGKPRGGTLPGAILFPGRQTCPSD